MGGRSPLGRQAAPLARCSSPTALTIPGPACCAVCRPSPELPFYFQIRARGDAPFLSALPMPAPCWCAASRPLRFGRPLAAGTAGGAHEPRAASNSNPGEGQGMRLLEPHGKQNATASAIGSAAGGTPLHTFFILPRGCAFARRAKPAKAHPDIRYRQPKRPWPLDIGSAASALRTYTLKVYWAERIGYNLPLSHTYLHPRAYFWVLWLLLNCDHCPHDGEAVRRR
jgi:hypothetical protein